MRSERCLDVVIVGLGLVGRALIGQLQQVTNQLNAERGVHLRIVGLADRGGVLHSHTGLPATAIGEALDAKLDGESIAALHLAVSSGVNFAELASPSTVFVDATAARGMARTWCDVLDAGAGVVLANKLPLCESWDQSRLLYHHPNVRYEATVGAGLPVLSTLRNLLATGDCVEHIDGVLSGTLGYLTGRLSDGIVFSEALAEAVDLGYAEPDPSEDLSGRDVARKAIILSRSVGWPVEQADITLEGLISDDQISEMSEGADASTLDTELASRFDKASCRGEAICYLAQVSSDDIRIGMTPVPQSSAFTSLAGPENRVAFHTNRYVVNPVGITGPGAGPDVTAAGILGDLIDLAEKTLRRGENS
ncbi:homoserine dehydrogenase [Candidatus Bipolaricaulota bacterium]|nr:homoserine dehydrogenase [Candidatus Bipolaricaulota bacterium]